MSPLLQNSDVAIFGDPMGMKDQQFLVLEKWSQMLTCAVRLMIF